MIHNLLITTNIGWLFHICRHEDGSSCGGRLQRLISHATSPQLARVACSKAFLACFLGHPFVHSHLEMLSVDLMGSLICNVSFVRRNCLMCI